MPMTVQEFILLEFTHLINNPCEEQYQYMLGILRMARFLGKITDDEYINYRDEAFQIAATR
ncbi:MAG: hypothetical protein IJ022_06210 [Burkholderiaceae bacterium]|nr:hypothetical protein [Burkholderiaceae bacterium]